MVNFINYFLILIQKQDKEFIESASTPELKSFLEIFTKTQLFEVFLTKKLTPNLNFGAMFDEAIREDQSQSSLNLTKPVSNSPKIKKIKQLSTYFMFI